MSLSLVHTNTLVVTETLGDTYVKSSNNTVTYDMASGGTFTGATGTPITKQAYFEKALVSGAGTIDFRALVGAAGSAVDGNGLKVQFIKFRGKSTNANPITITFGASNPYALLGSTFVVTLKANQAITCELAEGAIDIDGTHKTIDLSGTASQILEVAVIMG